MGGPQHHLKRPGVKCKVVRAAVRECQERISVRDRRDRFAGGAGRCGAGNAVAERCACRSRTGRGGAEKRLRSRLVSRLNASSGPAPGSRVEPYVLLREDPLHR
jgi:hypothetical protein